MTVLRQALEMQIAHNDPPEVADTLERLRAQGIAEREVWELLGAASLIELERSKAAARAFGRESYAATLRRLPSLDDDDWVWFNVAGV